MVYSNQPYKANGNTSSVIYLKDGSQIFCGSICNLSSYIAQFSYLIKDKLGDDAELWFNNILEAVFDDAWERSLNYDYTELYNGKL